MKELLEKSSTDVNAKGVQNRTAMHYAAVHGNIKGARALHELDAQAHEKDAESKTPSDYASEFAHVDVADAINKMQ